MNGAHKTVLLITPGGRDAPGGITRMVEYCVRAWPERSPFTLRVIDSYGPGSKFLMPFFALRAFILTAYLLFSGKAQLLHVNLSERLSLWRKGAFVLLANGLGVPVIIHLHGAEFADYIQAGGARRKRFASRLLARARKLIVLGSYWHHFLTAEMGVEPGKVVTLCNAVPDMGLARPREPSEVCHMIFLGVLGERKGVRTLLRALALPELKSLPWKMTIAGNGPVELYKSMAYDLGISDRVEFTGLLAEKQMRDSLGASDIFVLPSRQEGLPMAILEAMSYGCAVVSTPVGSIPDAVIDGRTGLLVPVDTPSALAAALARLISDGAYRRQLGACARKLFEERFAITPYNKTLESVYREVMSPSV